jgi:hypothetical protein
MVGRRRHRRADGAASGTERLRVAEESSPVEPRTANVSPSQVKPFSLSDIFDKLSLFIAPPTFVIALAFWFGWTMTNARAAYFGIDSSMLGLSTDDYLLRSADAAFVPIAVVLVILLAAVALHGLMRSAITAGHGLEAIKRGAISGALLGAVLTSLGVWAMFEPLPVATNYLVPPVILGLGPSLIAYSTWTLRRVAARDSKEAPREVPTWERMGYAIAVALALLGVFWASSLYASALGLGRAEAYAQTLSARPAVTVFSVRSLDIEAPGITAIGIADESSEYRFKYSGLRLLIYSANKYFLVNQNWSPGSGVTIVLQDTSDIRLEFASEG